MKKNIVFTLLLAMLPLSTLSAQVQWQQVLTASGHISVIYFYNSNLGFVTVGVPSGTFVNPVIYRTGDGGKTWMVASTPKNNGFGVNDIFMEDEQYGWAGSDNRNGRIWRTTDGGRTWNAVSSNENSDRLTNSVRRTSQGLLISDFMGFDIELSSDQGRTFRRIYAPPTADYVLGMDFVDSNHGAAVTTFRSANSWSYTSDGGLTWHPSNFGLECWTIRAMKGTSTFFAIPEGRSDFNDYLSEVMRSDDYGVTWQKQRTLDFRSTSDVEVCGNNLYVQTSAGGCPSCSFPDGKGIYRSTDSGMTWHGIGGPEYWNDTRFATAKTCKGTAVFCADVNNHVYKIIDTAVSYPVDITAGLLNTRITPPDSLNITTCQMWDMYAHIDVDECYKLVITTEHIEGRDSEYFSLAPSLLPLILSGQGADIQIYVNPRDSGTFLASLHLKGFFDYGARGTVAFDTIIPLHAHVKAAKPNFEVDKNTITFDISPCVNQREATFSLINKGCDTLRIVAGPGNTIPFVFEPLDLPFVLPPSSSKSLRVWYNPDSLGIDTATAIFIAQSHYEVLSQVITLISERGEKKPMLGVGNALLNFQTVYLCNGSKTMSMDLMNPGCDTLLILSDSIFTPEFTINSISFPVIIPPKGSTTVTITFHPNLPCNYSDTLLLHFKNHAFQNAALIRLTGRGEVNPPKISLSAWNMGFHSISTCEQPHDTVIILRNDGCDSLSVISGPGVLADEFTINKLTYPITLAPNDSIAFTLTFHPLQGGSFTTVLDYIIERFDVREEIEIPVKGICIQGLGILENSPNSFTFSPVNMCSPMDSLEGIIWNTGCDSLVVGAVALIETPAFSLSPLKLPLYLAPNEAVHYTVYCTLRTKGEYKSVVIINAYSAHANTVKYTNAIPISASVGDGIRTCAINRSEINFGANTLCAIVDSEVSISNTGCDTVTIESGEITGSGFAFRNTMFPLILGPEKSVTIPITSIADTTGHKQWSDAILSFESNAISPLSPVKLQRENIYPARYEIMLGEKVKSGKPGDTIELQIYAADDLKGINSLDLDLSYNTDLLGYLRTTGPNHVDITNCHIRITGNSGIKTENGVLLTITFEVFLAKEQTTDIVFSNPHFNASDPFFEKCIATASIQSNSVRFSSSYSCGEQTISNMMNGHLSLSIKSVYPNPAQQNITVEFNSPISQEAILSVYDALGKETLRKIIVKATEKVALDISAIPSGLYMISVSGEGQRLKLPFMKSQ